MNRISLSLAVMFCSLVALAGWLGYRQGLAVGQSRYDEYRFKILHGPEYTMKQLPGERFYETTPQGENP